MGSRDRLIIRNFPEFSLGAESAGRLNTPMPQARYETPADHDFADSQRISSLSLLPTTSFIMLRLLFVSIALIFLWHSAALADSASETRDKLIRLEKQTPITILPKRSVTHEGVLDAEIMSIEHSNNKKDFNNSLALWGVLLKSSTNIIERLNQRGPDIEIALGDAVVQNKIRSENISVWLIADKNARYIFCEPALAQHKEFKTVTAMRILSDASAMEYLIIHVRRGPKIKLTAQDIKALLNLIEIPSRTHDK